MRGGYRLRVLIGSTAAALVVSVLGAAGSAVGASTAAPAATSIAIRVLQQTIAPGEAGTVVGNLKVLGGSPKGRQLALEAQATGEEGFTPVGTSTAGGKGDVRISVQPAVTTRYRWHYAGAADARSRVSGVVVVRVQSGEHPGHRLATSLSIRAVTGVVSSGGRDAVLGTLVSGKQALRGRFVVLLARQEGRGSWQFRKVTRTGRHGGVKFTVRPKARTDYKLAFAGTAKYQPVRSGFDTVAVRPTVSIALTPAAIDPGESAKITGTVVQTRSPVAGATVDLLARTVGPGTTWKVAESGITTAEGAVVFKVSPLGNTRYRLRAGSAGGLPTGASRVVELGVRAPSSLSIRGEAVADGFAVIGQLRAQGDPVSNALITLQTFDTATTGWNNTASTRTASNGVVRFVQASAPGSDYRLVYAGKSFARSTSATLTDRAP